MGDSVEEISKELEIMSATMYGIHETMKNIREEVKIILKN